MGAEAAFSFCSGRDSITPLATDEKKVTITGTEVVIAEAACVESRTRPLVLKSKETMGGTKTGQAGVSAWRSEK